MTLAASGYEPLETFARLTLPDAPSATRAADGSPTPGYWQNRADYVLHARLLADQKVLEGDEVITYTNNSPQSLEYLWLQLDQNIYRSDARARYTSPRRAPSGGAVGATTTQGDELDLVEVKVGSRTEVAQYRISDTRAQIILRNPLKAHAKLQLHIRYHYAITGPAGGRTAWVPSKNGDIFTIAQWYPRMAVYDDLRGWDTLPYIGSEFYLEYGDFDYFVTVPADMLVVGSGELANPEQVLSSEERRRLDEARHSDATVIIRGPESLGQSHATNALEVTWHFRMQDSRDVAFAASRAYLWDAARINLPDQRTALAMSVYPVESSGPEAWGRSTQYFKDSVENFSRRWYPYPYPVAINVAGAVSAMEYPGVAFDEMNEKGKRLFFYSAHEIGHTWFPMIVGFNERRDAWMDEGFNTFIDVFESDDFNHGEYGPKRDNEYAPGGGNPVEEIQSVLKDAAAPALLTNADVIPGPIGHPLSYFKSALGLMLLRECILGEERFDFAFRKFIRDWAYRHPSPSDFFRAMDSGAGEDLSWFWRGWYFNNWNADFAVQKVEYVNGDPAQGATVTVATLDKLILPLTLQVDYVDGSHRRIELPAETWIQRGVAQIGLDPGGPIAAVIVDPDQRIPDRDRSNNTLTLARPAP